MAALLGPGLLLLLLSALTAPCAGGGSFELKLLKYVNRYGLDKTKDYCDSAFGARTSPCDFFFKILLNSKVGSSGTAWPMIQTQIYYDRDTVEFGRLLSSSQGNPIRKPFSSWQGRLNYAVYVIDDDRFTGHDDADFLSGQLRVSADGLEHPMTLRGTVHGANSALTVLIKVTCDLHYYTDSCTKYCAPQDDSAGHYTCSAAGDKECRLGWRNPASNCVDRDLCVPNPCQNSGVCLQTPTSRHCYCQTNFHGVNCEIRRWPCELENKCQNGGRCVNQGYTSSRCECLKGWTGTHCETDVDECATSPCANGATCMNERPGYVCHCAVGFSGVNCTDNIDECKTATTSTPAVGMSTTSPLRPCENGGVCVDRHGSFACLCLPGFSGSRCQDDVDECAAAAPACQNNGTCHNTFGGFNCTCARGFTGRHCELDVNECAAAPPVCRNGGVCANSPGGFACRCPPGFTGAVCNQDEDECALDAEYCKNGGRCNNTRGSAVCVCPAAFEGPRCRTPVDVCSRLRPCRHGGRCANRADSRPGYECNCAGTGFRGLNCNMDIDECAEGGNNDTCRHPQGLCRNTAGAFACDCVEPYYGAHCENCSASATNGSLCLGPKPAARGGRGAKAGGWVAAVVIILLLLAIIAALVFLAYRRRKTLILRLPASVRCRFGVNANRPAAHHNPDDGKVDIRFGNPTYGAGDGHSPSADREDSGTFNNDVYMTLDASTAGRRSDLTSASEGFVNSAYDPDEGPRNAYDPDTITNDAYDPDGIAIVMPSARRPGGSHYDMANCPAVLRPEDAGQYAEPEERRPAALSDSSYGGQYADPEEGARAARSDSSYAGSAPRSASSFNDYAVGPLSASSLPSVAEPARGPSIGHEGEYEEDPYGYAELPERTYSTLDRRNRDLEARQLAQAFDAAGDFPPAPPLPPRGGDNAFDVVFEDGPGVDHSTA